MNKSSDELSKKYSDEIMRYYNMQKNKSSVPEPAPDNSDLTYPEPELPDYISSTERNNTDISQGTAMRQNSGLTTSNEFIASSDARPNMDLSESGTTPEIRTRQSLEPGPVIPQREELEPGPVIPPREESEPGPVIAPREESEPGPVIPPREESEPGPVIPPREESEPGPVIPQEPQIGPVPIVPEDVPLEPGPVVPPEDSGTVPNTSYGKLRVEVKSGNRAVPIEDALVVITKQSVTGNELLSVMLTNSNGETQTVSIPAPPEALSETPSNVTPFAKVNVNAYKKGFYEVENNDIPIFAGITSIQPVNMIPLPYEDSAQKIIFTGREPDL